MSTLRRNVTGANPAAALRPVDPHPSRDVTAVVLTIGEDFTERALASVRRQTLSVSETIVVEGVTPVHRAVNTGAGRVRTRFFVQVDADMILDACCVETLRSCMSERLGLGGIATIRTMVPPNELSGWSLRVCETIATPP